MCRVYLQLRDGRSFLRLMEDAENVQFTPLLEHLVNDDVGQASNDPLACPLQTARSTRIRKALEQTDRSTKSRTYAFGRRRISFPYIFANGEDLQPRTPYPPNL